MISSIEIRDQDEHVVAVVGKDAVRGDAAVIDQALDFLFDAVRDGLTDRPIFPTRIQGCSVCGTDHDVLVRKLNQPGKRFTHWAICPTMGDPIFISSSPIILPR